MVVTLTGARSAGRLPPLRGGWRWCGEAQGTKGGEHMRGQWRLDHQCPAVRMRQHQPARMQVQTTVKTNNQSRVLARTIRVGRPPPRPIGFVAEDGGADRGTMHPQLMRSSGEG